MQRTDPPAGPAKSEKSRTESEGQARPLFLLARGALATPKKEVPEPISTVPVQTYVNMHLSEGPDFTTTRLLTPRPGQNNAHSCTLAAGHYSAQEMPLGNQSVAITSRSRRD